MESNPTKTKFWRMWPHELFKLSRAPIILLLVDQHDQANSIIFSTWQADNHRQIFRLSDSKMSLEFPSGQPLMSIPVCVQFVPGLGSTPELELELGSTPTPTPELELELELKPPEMELELELIFWRLAGVGIAGVGVGVETSGVGVGVGVDIMELTPTLICTLLNYYRFTNAFHNVWLINYAQDKHYRTHLKCSIQVIFYPIFTDLGGIW